MVLTAYELALIAGGFTILGALVGSLCTYGFALQLERRRLRREAGRRLREAFLPEFAHAARSGFRPDITFAHQLQAAHSKHLAALEEFKYHLDNKASAKLEAAWAEYDQPVEAQRFFDYYMGDHPAQTFKDRVEAILRLTRK